MISVISELIAWKGETIFAPNEQIGSIRQALENFLDYAFLGSPQFTAKTKTPQLKQSPEGIPTDLYLIDIRQCFLYPLYSVSAVILDYFPYLCFEMIKLVRKPLIRVFVIVVGILGNTAEETDTIDAE